MGCQVWGLRAAQQKEVDGAVAEMQTEEKAMTVKVESAAVKGMKAAQKLVGMVMATPEEESLRVAGLRARVELAQAGSLIGEVGLVEMEVVAAAKEVCVALAADLWAEGVASWEAGNEQAPSAERVGAIGSTRHRRTPAQLHSTSAGRTY